MPALMRKPPWPALTGGPPKPPGSLRRHGRNAIRPGEQAAAAVRAAEAELARARQAETDARDQARQTRDDAAREREALAGQYQAWLEAAGQLAAAERARALRAEQCLDAERERHDSLLAALTAPGGEGTQPAAGGPGGPAGRRPRARGTAGNTS